jgi:hypothetical protein
MKVPTSSELTDAFRRHGAEPPPEYLWLVKHGTLGFDAFTQFEPWHFCGIEEILPLAKRWPNSRLNRNLLPFARFQGGDDLACFEFEAGKLLRICHVHYGLPGTAGGNVYIEIWREYPSLWDWLHAVVDEVKVWFNISNQRTALNHN